MQTLAMPAGNLGVAAPSDDGAYGGTRPGQTAKKPQQRFADVPSLSKMEEKPKSDRRSEKTSGRGESVGQTISDAARKRTGSSVQKADGAEIPAVDPGWFTPASAQVAGKRLEGVPATGSSGKVPLSPAANAGAQAETGHTSDLQKLRSMRMPPSSATGSMNESRLLAGKQTAKGDAGASVSETAHPAAKAVAGSAKPSGGPDKTEASVSKLHPGSPGEPGQAARQKARDGEMAASFARRAPDQGAAGGQKAAEAKAAGSDPSGASSAAVKGHVPVPDRAGGHGVKEAAEVGQWSAMQTVKMREHSAEESRSGGRQGAGQQPGARLFADKKDSGPLSAKELHPAVSQGELHTRPEFAMSAVEPSSPALRPLTADHAISDGPSLRSPVQNVSEQILDSVHASVVRGDKQLLVRLQPPELGTVLVRFREQGGEIQAVMEVDQSDTRREIEQALPQVLRGLQDAGVQIKRLDVVPHDQPDRDSGRGPFQQDGSMPQQNQGHNPGQMHDHFQPSWGTQWGPGRQDVSNAAQDDAGGISQGKVGQGRIDVLL